MNNFRFLFSCSGVKKEEMEDCFLWAFGEGYGVQPIRKLVGLWNSRHEDIFLARGHMSILDFAQQIAEAWNKYAGR